MQRQLILMRHAHAEPEANDNDFERQLTSEGRLAARRAGTELARSGFVPDAVLSSSAHRALATAEIVAAACGFLGTIDAARGLYLATEAQYLEALHALEGTRQLLLVGHNPDLSSLARKLDRQTSGLAPAQYARLELDLSSWRELGRAGR